MDDLKGSTPLTPKEKMERDEQTHFEWECAQEQKAVKAKAQKVEQLARIERKLDEVLDLLRAR